MRGRCPVGAARRPYHRLCVPQAASDDPDVSYHCRRDAEYDEDFHGRNSTVSLSHDCAFIGFCFAKIAWQFALHTRNARFCLEQIS